MAIAATGDDKANLVMSLLAKTEFGVPRTVGRVNHPKNEWLFNEVWGVDVAVSTPRLMSALVEEAVTVGDLVRLLTFHEGETNLVEMTLPASSPCVGQRIGDLTWPGDVVLVAIIRDGHARPPDADGSLEAGDELLFVTAQDYEKELAQMLSPRDPSIAVAKTATPRTPDPSTAAEPPGVLRRVLPRPPASRAARGRPSGGRLLHRGPALGQHQADHRQGGDQQRPAQDDLGHAEPDHLAGEEQRQLDRRTAATYGTASTRVSFAVILTSPRSLHPAGRVTDGGADDEADQRPADRTVNSDSTPARRCTGCRAGTRPRPGRSGWPRRRRSPSGTTALAT